MDVIYSISYQHSTSRLGQSIFLAGPTPRAIEVPSWRPEALMLLHKFGYEGLVFVPEPETNPLAWRWSKEDQLNWEHSHLKQARCVLFWIPRSADKLPGLTTNLEFGMWLIAKPTKVAYGATPEAWKMNALDYYAKLQGINRHYDLESTVQAAINITTAPLAANEDHN